VVAITVAVTNNPFSASATAAKCHVDIAAGPELLVAATKTCPAQLLVLGLLVSAVSDTSEPHLGCCRTRRPPSTRE